MNIEEQFMKYKNITSRIIEVVKLEDYEILEDVFSKRQLVLDDMGKIDCLREELKSLYIKYDIGNLEKTLADEMENRKEEILNKIKENQKRKTAMNGYNNLQARAVFLSKEL